MTPLGDEVSPPRPSRFCPGCGKALEEGDVFCPFCGRALGMWPGQQQYRVPQHRPPSTMETVRRAGRGITAVALGALFVLLFVNVVILVWSPTVVLPVTEDPSHGNTLFLIIPWSEPILPLFEVSGWSFALYHVLLVVAIAGSFVWMAVRSYGTFRRELALVRPPEGHSPLWTIGTVFFAVLAFNSIYVLVLTFLGIEATTPDFPSKELWQLLNGLASASVWEELVTRVLYIGVPLLIIDLWRRKAKPLRRYFLGGGFELGGKELALVWASAGVFALAHIVYWDAWKIAPTWMAGLAFGFLFLRLGLYACIMLHFAVDYLTIPLEVGGGAVVILVLGLLILFWDVLGGLYLVVFTNRVLRFLTGADLGSRRARAAAQTVPPGPPSPPPSAPAGPRPPAAPPPAKTAAAARFQGPGFYSCTRCGNTEARYVDGKLECTRCGHRD